MHTDTREIAPLAPDLAAYVRRVVESSPPLSEAAIAAVSDILNALALAREKR